MYVTRPLSMYKRNPSALALPPPEGPNSGILVIQDEEAEPTCCFGLFLSDEVKDLPFPQNKNLRVRYTTSSGAGQSQHSHTYVNRDTTSSGAGQNQHSHTYVNRVVFIPVLNQPLSSNRYYVIERRGSHRGEAHTNATEEDVSTCCYGCCIPDMEPMSFDHKDVYQQFEIRRRDWGGYVARSVAPDGFPPNFLRRKGWRVGTSTPHDFELNEAPGLDKSLRARLPEFYFPLSQKSSPPVVVGKWYCPFMFVKEGRAKDQVDISKYYVMTLEQRWEQIFASENDSSEGKSVAVDVVVQREAVAVAGSEAVPEPRNIVDGVMWFRSFGNVGGEASVGLSLAIVERMKWEQERVGWLGGNEIQVHVKRVEEFEGTGSWKKFGCYVLVERFVLRRMDGSLVLTYDFKHTHQIRSKWE